MVLEENAHAVALQRPLYPISFCVLGSGASAQALLDPTAEEEGLALVRSDSSGLQVRPSHSLPLLCTPSQNAEGCF